MRRMYSDQTDIVQRSRNAGEIHLKVYSSDNTHTHTDRARESK